MNIDASLCLLRHETNGNSSAWLGEHPTMSRVFKMNRSFTDSPWHRRSRCLSEALENNRRAAQGLLPLFYGCAIFFLNCSSGICYLSESKRKCICQLRNALRLTSHRNFFTSALALVLWGILTVHDNKLGWKFVRHVGDSQTAQTPRIFCWSSPFYRRHNWVLHRLFDFNKLTFLVFCVLVAG